MPLGFYLSFYFFLIASTIPFLLHQQHRCWFAVRILIALVVGFLPIYLLNSFYVYSFLRNIFLYTSALFSLVFFARFCYSITWSESVFCAVGGYSVQFILSTTGEMVSRLGLFPQIPFPAISFLSAFVIIPLCYFLFCRKLNRGQNFDLNKFSLFLLPVTATLVEIVLCTYLRGAWEISKSPLFIFCDCLLLIICSFSLLTIQFSLLVEKKLEDELEIQENLLRKKEIQYHISREVIDTLNQKCHDMRHQIHTIGKNARIDPQALAEIESAIGIYDSLHQTGSKALDIILAEKALLCQGGGIEINCMADGEKLAFMGNADIYSLFGNILENAIHGVQPLDPEQRTVSLTVKQYGAFLSVNSHNRYAGCVKMEKGIPVTASTDTANRGYGVKSIIAITEKYGGTYSFQAKDGLFNLNILIPIKESFEKTAAAK